MGWADGFTLVLVSLGALFFFAGWVGLMRFPDPLCRLHALSKADNLGLGLVLIGLLPQASWPFGALKLVALWLLALLAAGATSQMLAGAIHRHGVVMHDEPGPERGAVGGEGSDDRRGNG
jgi:multicomponent Na+:H+ antiporter subunit G